MPTKKQLKAQRQQAKQQQKSGVLIDLGKQKQPSWRKSTSDQLIRLPKYTEQQQPILDLITQYLQGRKGLQSSPLAGLNLPGSQQYSFAPIRNEAIRQFEEEGVPSIAERFQSLGGRDAQPGALSSGPLYNQLRGSRRQLESQLAALEAQYGLQNQQQQSGNLFNLLGAGLGSQYDIGNIPGQNSGVRQAALGATNLGLNYLTGGGLGGLFGGRQQRSTLGSNQGNQQQIYQNNAGFTPQQGIGFVGQQQGLGIQGINNSILQGYGDQLLPQNNNFQF